MNPITRRALALALAAHVLVPSAAADRVVTVDGRILSPKKARVLGAGYRLVFENGEIVLPDGSLVKSVEIEGDMSEYVPQNDDEKAKLAQGYVKYRGKWLSKPAYEETLRKEHEESRARTEDFARHSDWANAWTKETAHFQLRSNTSKELLDYYAELFEVYYGLMDQRIGIDPTPSLRRTKMQVNIFKNRAEFLELAPYGAQPPPGLAGFFSPHLKSLNFFHEYPEPAISTWIGLHECTHLLTYLIDPDYRPQIWCNEGVADYFGSSKVARDKKGKLTIVPGEVQTDRVLTVQQAIEAGTSALPTTAGATAGEPGAGNASARREGRPNMTLEELFAVSREDFSSFEYSHAWSFVYFLNNFDRGRYAKGFAQFFKGLYTLDKTLPVELEGGGKRVPPKAIRDYLLKKLGHKDTVQLEKEWLAFIAEVPIQGAEARLKRGLNAARQLDLAGALEDLNAAIEAGVTDPRAWATRARCLIFTDKMKEGLADLEKAIALDPLNPLYRYEHSVLLSEPDILVASAMGGGVIDAGVEEGKEDAPIPDKPAAKVQAGLAAELDPENERFRKWFARFE